MSLELKHLSVYLPYKLKIQNKTGKRNLTTVTIESVFYDLSSKLILRPLSDLDKLIEHNNEKFVPFDKMNWRPQFCDIHAVANSLENQLIEYRYFEMLISWHFDVFGLIEKGLAVDFNKA